MMDVEYLKKYTLSTTQALLTVDGHVLVDMLLMVLWVIENVKDECSRLFDLSVLVQLYRLGLEMGVYSFPEPTKSLPTPN